MNIFIISDSHEFSEEMKEVVVEFNRDLLVRKEKERKNKDISKEDYKEIFE